jgi:AcrR family transcriptional regulator
MNITLRNVAEEMKRGYGNITYYYSTKEKLITELYLDMIDELSVISNELMSTNKLFDMVLLAPEKTFNLSVKYLFLFKDYVEIKRQYQMLSQMIDESNKLRMNKLKNVLLTLQEDKLIRKEINEEDLYYLMEVSGAIRTFFFINTNADKLWEDYMKKDYIKKVNMLLIPYLTNKGKKAYDKFMKTIN